MAAELSKEWVPPLAVQVRLLCAYEMLGQEAKARELEAELRRLLTLADSDHWVLCQLDNPEKRCTAWTRFPWQVALEDAGQPAAEASTGS